MRAIHDWASHAPVILDGGRHKDHNDAEGRADLLQPDTPTVTPSPRGVTREYSEASCGNQSPWKEACVEEPYPDVETVDAPIPADVASRGGLPDVGVVEL